MKTIISFLKPPILYFLLLFLFLNTSISIGQTISTDGQAGPTLIITSQESNVFSNNSELIRSKCREFNITGEYTVNNCGVGTNIFLNSFINTAAFTWKSYQRIIILEGEYVVNGPIKLNNVNGSTNSLAIGKLTIEGEGFGTRIRNAANYNGAIFEINSIYNSVKNLSILTSNNNTGILISPHALAGAAVDPYFNVFENLYIGTPDMNGGTPPHLSEISINQKPTNAETNMRTGIRMIENNGVTNEEMHYNRFKNFIFNGLDKGIELVATTRIGHNHFEDLLFKNTAIGIDFINTENSEISAIRNNVFSNITLYGAFLRNIRGLNNSFYNCKLFNTITDKKYITIHNESDHTTFKDPYFKRDEVVDKGRNTQLLNCISPDFKITNKLGTNYQDPPNVVNYDLNNRNKIIKIDGKLKLSANDEDNNSTNSGGRYLVSDSLGYATWQPNITLTDKTWDQSATNNIKMNAFAITNYSNSSNNGLKGLYFYNGATKISNTAPTNTENNLEIDGNIKIKNGNNTPFLVKDGKTIIGNSTENYLDQVATFDDTYKLFVNGKMRIKTELRINQTTLPWPDYVFQKDYDLMPLEKIEEHIQQNGHLPNMPCAAEVEQTGVPLATMITKQHEKIEELTLHLIELQKEIDTLKQKQKK